MGRGRRKRTGRGTKRRRSLRREEVPSRPGEDGRELGQGGEVVVVAAVVVAVAGLLFVFAAALCIVVGGVVFVFVVVFALVAPAAPPLALASAALEAPRRGLPSQTPSQERVRRLEMLREAPEGVSPGAAEGAAPALCEREAGRRRARGSGSSSSSNSVVFPSALLFRSSRLGGVPPRDPPVARDHRALRRKRSRGGSGRNPRCRFPPGEAALSWRRRRARAWSRGGNPRQP